MKKIRRNFIAMLLTLSIAVTSLPGSVVTAMASEEDYVSGIYITYAKASGGKSAYQVAEDNFEEMLGTDVEYEVIAYDFNKDADAWASKAQGVFLAYTITHDSKEALTDIAAMNMDGGYTFSDYESVLQQKYKNYENLGTDEAALIENYRTMYKAGSPLAQFAYEQLNKNYYEDDSEQDFGDYLLTCDLLYTDEEKEERRNNNEYSIDPIVMVISQMTNAVLMNVNILLTIAAASNDQDNNLFTRLSALTESQISDYQEDAQYYDEAVSLMTGVKQLIEKTEAALEAVNALIEEGVDITTDEGMEQVDAEDQQYYILATHLKTVSYNGDSVDNLYDLLAKENLKYKELYPVLGVMTEAQRNATKIAGIELVLQSEIIGMSDDAKESLDQKIEEAREALVEAADEAYDEWAEIEEKLEEEAGVEEDDSFPDDVDEQVSIYVGVDRTLLNKSLAITSDALRTDASSKSYSLLSGNTWKEGRIALLAGFGAAVLTSAVSLAAYGYQLSIANNIWVNVYNLPNQVKGFFKVLGNTLPWNAGKTITKASTELNKTLTVLAENITTDSWVWDVAIPQELRDASNRFLVGRATSADIKLLYEESAKNEHYYDKMIEANRATYYASILGTVFWAAIGTAMIVAGAYGIAEVYAYYHPSKKDFSPRPEGLLDVGEDKDGVYKTLMYSGVYDTNGEIGDINGWVAKSWVALYTTKDPDAGTPILADETFGSTAVTTDKSHISVHMFGQTSAMSFNDYAYRTDNKIYLSFTRETEKVNTSIASIFSGNNNAVSVGIISGLGGIVLGALIVIIITKASRRKKVAGEK